MKHMIPFKPDPDDATSLTPISLRSPKPSAYYVQSPSSHHSHDEDKSSSTHATTSPAVTSPTDSPSHSSYSRHSRSSSSSRLSGPYATTAAGRRGGRYKRNDNEFNVIEEEELFYYVNHNNTNRRVLIGALGFVFVFSVFCLIIWGASRPFKPQINVQSLSVHNFYFGQGSDMTGVPTKMLTVNCSVNISVYNPATFFGIHVTFMPVHLMYYEIIVATGELKKYYQPRKSRRSVHVNVEGVKVPLYGAGVRLAVSDNNRQVPFTLAFDVRSRGYVVGRMVKSRHARHVSCSLAIDSRTDRPIKFNNDSCAYQ
ncbi:uncharacterized protein LOC8268356 [Ricinus communis]|uniref:uncharacterized protein LOC8268356 n=1 Tax=Ricinus communis TaxID=3988 RepID=UPI00201A7D5E|nr:uncharacterized protein LOC8268356 [Ricinus communis]